VVNLQISVLLVLLESLENVALAGGLPQLQRLQLAQGRVRAVEA